MTNARLTSSALRTATAQIEDQQQAILLLQDRLIQAQNNYQEKYRQLESTLLDSQVEQQQQSRLLEKQREADLAELQLLHQQLNSRQAELVGQAQALTSLQADLLVAQQGQQPLQPQPGTISAIAQRPALRSTSQAAPMPAENLKPGPDSELGQHADLGQKNAEDPPLDDIAFGRYNASDYWQRQV